MTPDSVEPPAANVGHLRWRFANVEFDEADATLRVGGKPVVVEPRPLRLLLELLRHVNDVVTKEELLDGVWEGRPTVDHVLANAVSKLRAALGEAGAARLVTVPRVGYRLVGPVQRLAASAPEVVLQAGQPVPGRDGYLLERVLGKGAHGDVWSARHAKLGQVHVFKFASDGSRLSALKREYTLYRVLARELGPRDDFARVLDTNFVVAPYFIECAFGGQSLLEWAADGGRLSGLPTQARIDLFVQIARAVAAAHSVGVLHKDIKPGNVLVQRDGASRPGGEADGQADDERWQARLTDFGSGRLLDPTRLDGLQLTGLDMAQAQSAGADAGSGTPMYMAPELMAGQAPTVQSDVHALGVLLYQMLVGDFNRPLAQGWERDVADDLLRNDIAAASDGRPESRLQSVSALIDRLQRLTQRHAERTQTQAAARQLAASERLLERARARRPWVVLAFVLLATGLSASVWLGLQSRQSQRSAEQQAQRAEAISQFASRDLLGGVDVTGVGADGRVSMRDLLGRASELAPQRLKMQPQALRAVHGQLGRLYLTIADHKQAAVQYRKAVALATADELHNDPDVLALRFGEIRSRALLGNLRDVEPALRAVEQDAQPFLPRDRNLAVVATMARLTLVSQTGPMEQTVRLARRLVELADADEDDRYEMRFVSRGILGDALYRAGRPKDALIVFDQALAPPFAADSVGAIKLARLQLNRARAQAAVGELKSAEQGLAAARDALLQRQGPGDYFVNLAEGELGSVHDLQGDFGRARQAYDAAQKGYERSAGPTDPMTKVMAINVAVSDINLGHAEPGLRALDALRQWWVQFLGSEAAPVVQAIDFDRARALNALGRPGEAGALLARLTPEALTEASPQSRDWSWRLQAEKGRALLRARRPADALPLLRAAVPGLEASGSAPWVLGQYRQLLNEAAAAR